MIIHWQTRLFKNMVFNTASVNPQTVPAAYLIQGRGTVVFDQHGVSSRVDGKSQPMMRK